MPRVIWKGNISFGLVSIPVGLYPAEKKEEVNLVQLDKKDLSPIGYKKYNKQTGQEAPPQDIVKGYEYEEGHFVILTDEDLKKANVKATQTVEILDFVDSKEVPPVYFDKPYYLGPTEKGRKGYALLRETLKRTGKAGIAKVVIHTKEYLAALIPYGNVLLLDLMRYASELRDASELDLPSEDLSELGVSDKEVNMAERLVEGMADRWEPAKYHDKFREDVAEMVRQKIATGETKAAFEEAAKEVAARGEVVDLMGLLKQSVEKQKAAREKKAA